MRGMRMAVGVGLMLASVACSGEAPTPTSDTPSLPSGSEATPPGSPLFYFEGSVDTAKGTMAVAYRAPTGELQAQTTLPYGNSAGSVYFHTCGVPTYNAGTHQLTGAVQAVNRMATTQSSFIAIIDSVSLAGVTPASGTIATYGTVAPNSADCGTTQSWVFTNPTDANFTFTGHADGTTAGSPVTIPITQAMMFGTSSTCVSPHEFYSTTTGSLGFSWTDTTNAIPASIQVQFAPGWARVTGVTRVVYLNGTQIGSYTVNPSGFTCAFNTAYTQTVTASTVAPFVRNGVNTITVEISSGSASLASINGTATYAVVTLN